MAPLISMDTTFSLYGGATRVVLAAGFLPAIWLMMDREVGGGIVRYEGVTEGE